MKLRQNRIVVLTFNERSAFYEKYNFSVTIEKVDIGKRSPLKYFCIDHVSSSKKTDYNLRTIKCTLSSSELNNHDIIHNYAVSRNYVQPKDVLYAIYTEKKVKIVVL